MISHIDWLSFSFESNVGEGVASHNLLDTLVNEVLYSYPITAEAIFNGYTWTPRVGRAPYRLGWERDDHGVVLFGGTRLPHALVEISGRGCEALGSTEQAYFVLEEIQSRLTRLDIACDMLTDCPPDEFCALRDGKRFKSFGEIKSETGHTVYIGSRSSDRYARVYRYTEPHPRAHLLRSEFVLKGEQAKLAARELLAVGVDLYAAHLGNSFGWKHKVWLPNEWSVEEAKAWRPDREAGNTVRWLYSQVAPALIKLHREGQLDAQIWFAEAVLNSIVYPPASENDAPLPAVE